MERSTTGGYSFPQSRERKRGVSLASRGIGVSGNSETAHQIPEKIASGSKAAKVEGGNGKRVVNTPNL